MNLKDVSTEDLLYIMEQVAAGGPEMIEEDWYEIHGEDEQGREGISIISLCGLMEEVSLRYNKVEGDTTNSNLRISNEAKGMVLVASSSEKYRNNGYVTNISIFDHDHGTSLRFPLTGDEAKALSEWISAKSNVSNIEYY